MKVPGSEKGSICKPAGRCRFLAALPAEDAERLMASAAHVELPLQTVLYKRNEIPRYMYLLTSGMSSAVYTSEQGNSIELSMIGDEGPVGWLLLLGKLPPVMECTMQVGGAGYRLPTAVLQREFDTNEAVRRTVLEFAQYKTLNAYQIAACNRLHKAGQRFARWLLTASDRSRLESMQLTQEFLGQMLGTRRTTVAEEAGRLQRLKAIEYSRGHIRITNRALLEQHACECYAITAKQFDSLFRE